MKVTLKSGNTFYYVPQTDTMVSIAVVVKNNSNIVIGGFVAKEADRKCKVFMEIGVSYTDETIDFNELDFLPIYTSLKRYGDLFYPYRNVMIADNMAGSVSACDRRYRYWRAVGLDLFITDKRIECPIWGIMLNHLSVFGRAKFDESFANKHTQITGDSIINMSIFRPKHKYAVEEIRTPAIFLLKRARMT